MLARLIAPLLILGFAASAHADGPAGTWKWVWHGKNGAPDETITVRLDVNGDKVTGTANVGATRKAPAHTLELTDGTWKDRTVAFTLVKNADHTFAYSGTVDGDSISGTIQYKRNGEPLSRNWKAERVK